MKNTKAPEPKRVSRLLLGVISLTCLGLALWVAQMRSEMDALKGAAASAEERAEAATRQVKAAAAKSRQAQRQAQPVAEGGAAVKEEIVETSSGEAERKRKVNQEEMKAMMSNPAMRDIIGTQESVMTKLTYSDLSDRLQLSSEERDYFQKLLIEKRMSTVNLGMQLTSAGISPEEKQALIQQLVQARNANDAKIHEFLNDDGDYVMFQSYGKQEQEHQEVGMFESAIAGTTPLQPAQADALTAAIADTRKNFAFTVDFYDESNFVKPQLLTNAALDKFFAEQVEYQSQVAQKAAEILSPEQLKAFQQNQAGSRQMMKLKLNWIVQSAQGGNQ